MPGRPERAVVATVAAFIATGITWSEHVRIPGRSTDFGEIWFGARALLHGLNPYMLIGPGRAFQWEWISPYPVTAFVAAIPFTLLPEFAAALLFVWLSVWVLTYLITRKGWQRLFLLPSAAVMVAARAAQWSPLFAAIFLEPRLGWFLSLKPNLGVAVFAGRSKQLFLPAAAGAIVFLAVGSVLQPSWIPAWLNNVRHISHTIVPIMRPGGFLVLFSLFQWKDPEARLLVVLACVPQTGSWYESLPILLVAHTKRECQLLSMLSSVGFIASTHLVPTHSELQINRDVATFMIWFVYIPATVILLRRERWTPQRRVFLSFASQAASRFKLQRAFDVAEHYQRYKVAKVAAGRSRM